MWGHTGWVKLTDSGVPWLGRADGGTWAPLVVTSSSSVWESGTAKQREALSGHTQASVPQEAPDATGCLDQQLPAGLLLPGTHSP